MTSMKRFMRIRKITWILCFWALFFVLVIFMTSVENLSTHGILSNLRISLSTISLYFGALLIANRVYSIKGRIKRVPYFLNLLALLFMLAILGNVGDSLNNFFQNFLFIILSFLNSYFFAAAYSVAEVSMKIFDLGQEILGLKIPTGFIRSLILGLLYVGIIYPFVVLNIKRLKDMSFSGWFSLISLIPVVSVLFEIFLCLKGSGKFIGRVKSKNTK